MVNVAESHGGADHCVPPCRALLDRAAELCAAVDLKLTQRSEILVGRLDQHALTAAPFPSVAVEVPSVGFGRLLFGASSQLIGRQSQQPQGINRAPHQCPLPLRVTWSGGDKWRSVSSGLRPTRSDASPRIDRTRRRNILGLREHPLFWAACVLAVASFAYGTYLLMAWSPATTWPSDLPSWPLALGFYAAGVLCVLMALLAVRTEYACDTARCSRWIRLGA